MAQQIPVNGPQNYLIDGDEAFLGLNSRDNPINLPEKLVSKSQNLRLEKGTAVLRKGAKLLDVGEIRTNNIKILGSCLYSNNETKEDFIVLATKDRVYHYKISDGTLSQGQMYIGPYENEGADQPSEGDNIKLYQGGNKVYINNGFFKAAWVYDVIYSSLTYPVKDDGETASYPKSSQGVYFGNRHIIQTGEQTFQVSYYLKDDSWSSLDQFTVNSGNGDSIVSITPWQLNEFIIFMKNSIYYASVGVGAVAEGGVPTEANSYVKSMATDIGCIAKESVVQAGGGVLFLSTNGIYMLDPSGVAGKGTQNTPEGMRLVTIAKPLSAEIDDAIKRINVNSAHLSTGIYWNNRYYLAVPLNGEDGTLNEKINYVLIYNFITKAWESVDKYPDDYDIRKFYVANYENKNRLFAVDYNLGIFLMEELEYDSNKDFVVGTPYFDATNESVTLGDEVECLITYGGPGFTQITGELVTRGYTFKTVDQKRVSHIAVDCGMKKDDELSVSLITKNPDTENVEIVYNSEENNDVLLRIPVKRTANYIQIKVKATKNTPEIKKIAVKAIKQGESAHSNY